MSNEPSGGQPPNRDSEILQMLGIFLVILSLPVLVGTIWAEGTFERLINVAAALIIGAIGGGMIWRARRTSRSG